MTPTASLTEARTAAIVDAQWLEDHLDDPCVRIVEVDVSSKAHQEGHIPGAVLWNIYRDMRDDGYQLRPTVDLERLIQNSGITDETVIVFYGYAPAIGFWLMHHFGHAELRILDTDRTTWQREGRPWTRDQATPEATDYRIPFHIGDVRASKDQVMASLESDDHLILDVRSHNEYIGRQFWPSGGSLEGGRAGHIPSAVHIPADGILDQDGSFLPAEDLRRIFAQVDRRRQVTTYCTVGARAATVWFILTHILEHDNVRVYDGSWAEWGQDPKAPIDQGHPSSSR